MALWTRFRWSRGSWFPCFGDSPRARCRTNFLWSGLSIINSFNVKYDLRKKLSGFSNLWSSPSSDVILSLHINSDVCLVRSSSVSWAAAWISGSISSATSSSSSSSSKSAWLTILHTSRSQSSPSPEQKRWLRKKGLGAHLSSKSSSVYLIKTSDSALN